MAKLDSTSLRLRKHILDRLNAHRPQPLGSRDAFIERLLVEVCEQIEAEEPPGLLPTVKLLRELKNKPTESEAARGLHERVIAIEKQLLDLSGKNPTTADSEAWPPNTFPGTSHVAQPGAATVGKTGSTHSLNEGPDNAPKPIGKTRRALRRMVDREAEQKSTEGSGS